MSSILSIAFFFLCFLPNTAGAQESGNTYLEQLLQRAKAMALHEQRYWHLLLHYRSSLGGGVESEADEPGWQELRWDLEELRVSLFAQELGARGGVSPKKLAQRLASLRR